MYWWKLTCELEAHYTKLVSEVGCSSTDGYICSWKNLLGSSSVAVACQPAPFVKYLHTKLRLIFTSPRFVSRKFVTIICHQSRHCPHHIYVYFKYVRITWSTPTMGITTILKISLIFLS